MRWTCVVAVLALGAADSVIAAVTNADWTRLVQNADEQEFTFFGAQTSSCMSIDDALRARLFIASLTIVWRLLALAASGK